MELFAFDLYLEGLHFFTNPLMFVASAFGVLVGIIFGALPGLTATMTIAIFIPFTFGVDAVLSLLFCLEFIQGLYTVGLFRRFL